MDRNELKASLLDALPFCDVCGNRLREPDMHESIVTKQAARGWSKKKRKLINHRFNCHLVCNSCHTWAHAHPKEMVAIQISRHGYDEIQEWIDSLEFRVPFSWHRGLDQVEADRMAEIRRRT